MNKLITTSLSLCLCAASFGAQAQMKDLLNKSKGTLKKAANQQIDNATQGNSGSSSSGNSAPASSSATATSEPAETATYPGIAAPSSVKVTPPKRAGQIVFSGDINNLKKDEENESGFGDKFTLGKPIYFRAYVQMPLTDYEEKMFPGVDRMILSVHGRYKVRFTVDNGASFEQAMAHEDMAKDWKDQFVTFKGALTSNDGQVYLVEDIFKDFVSQRGDKLTNGDHKIKMQLMPYAEYPDIKTGDVIAEGTFTLNVNENSVDPNDPKYCLPTAHMNDKELEAGIIKAFKAKGWEEQPKEVRIISDKWDIERHKVTGVILRRTVTAVVASTRKGKCISQEFSFAQDYDGAQYQKEVYLYGTGGQKDINCKCITVK